MTKYPSVFLAILLVAFVTGTRNREAAAAAPPAYTVTDLGTLGGSYSSGSAINASGQVTGWSNAAGTAAEHAFLYDGTLHDLGTLGGTMSFGYGINDRGQVTGYSLTTEGSNHAFLYDGSMHDLGTLGGTTSVGYGVNSNGQVTGYSFLPGALYYEYRAFTWTESGGMRNLGTLGGASSIGYDINALGHVTGGSENEAGEFHAMLYDGAMHDLGTLGGYYSYGERINDSGQVTGVSYTTGDGQRHAFLWTPATPNGDSGTMHDLGTLGGTLSFGFDINNSGHVTGWSYTTGDALLHAFLYTSGNGIVDLNTLIDPLSGWELVNAIAINDTGQITGWGVIDGVQHAFLLTPVPEPASLSLLAIGLTLLVWRSSPRSSMGGIAGGRQLVLTAAARALAVVRSGERILNVTADPSARE